MKVQKIILFFTALLFFVGCKKNSTKNDENTPQIILRYADNQPDDYPTTKAARYFAALINDKTEGKVDIEVYGNAELGSEVEILQQIQFGGIDFARFSLGTLTDFIPSVAILQLPYLYKSSEHMWKVLDSEIGDLFLENINKSGVVGLCWFDAGARSLYLTSEAHTLEDLRGRIIRVQESELMSNILRQLNVQTIQIPYNHVYSALQTSKIDGAENNAPSYLSKGHNIPAPFFLLDEHLRIPEVVLMSTATKEKLDKLDKNYYSIIFESAKESGLYERELWNREEKNSLSTLQNSGCKIIELNSKEKERFITAMMPIYEDYRKEYGDIINKIQKK